MAGASMVSLKIETGAFQHSTERRNEIRRIAFHKSPDLAARTGSAERRFRCLLLCEALSASITFAVACEVRAQPISLIVSAPSGAQPQFSPDLFTGVPGRRILLNATIIN